VGFLDELQSGGPVLGAPELERELGIAHGGTGFWLFTAPILVCMVVEPVLLLATERWKRRPMLALALVCMAAGQVLVAAAGHAWTLALAIAFWGTAIGFADSQAEMALVQSDPRRVDRSMTRWAIAASLGDFLGPLFVAGAVVAGGSWRSVALVSAVLALADALLVWRGPDFDAPRSEDEPPPAPLREAIGALAKDRAILWWLLAGASCALLDEIFVVFGGLHVVESGGSLASSALSFASYAIGGVVGLALAERSGLAPRAVLRATAAATAVLLAAWIAHPVGPAAYGIVFALGAVVAPHHPLSRARVYEAAGDRPAIANALSRPFDSFDVLLPWALGALADARGLVAALALLLVQPALIAAVATWAGRGGGSATPRGGGTPTTPPEDRSAAP
jgi:predicted MFS family arabinose efflux permease